MQIIPKCKIISSSLSTLLNLIGMSKAADNDSPPSPSHQLDKKYKFGKATLITLMEVPLHFRSQIQLRSLTVNQHNLA